MSYSQCSDNYTLS